MLSPPKLVRCFRWLVIIHAAHTVSTRFSRTSQAVATISCTCLLGMGVLAAIVLHSLLSSGLRALLMVSSRCSSCEAGAGHCALVMCSDACLHVIPTVLRPPETFTGLQETCGATEEASLPVVRAPRSQHWTVPVALRTAAPRRIARPAGNPGAMRAQLSPSIASCTSDRWRGH
jgi:hypothetical protein